MIHIAQGAPGAPGLVFFFKILSTDQWSHSTAVRDGKYVPERLTIATGRPTAINSAQNGWILSTRNFQWEPQGFFFCAPFSRHLEDRGSRCLDPTMLVATVLSWILFRSQGPLGLSTPRVFRNLIRLLVQPHSDKSFYHTAPNLVMPRGSQKLTVTWTLKQQMPPESNVLYPGPCSPTLDAVLFPNSLVVLPFIDH